MRIYISGKITGLEKEVYTKQFARAEAFYKTSGFDVINPVKIGEEILKKNPSATWEDFMKEDLKAIQTCTHIVLLEGWEESKGAKIEKAEAEKLGLEIMQLKFFGGKK